MAVSLPDNMDEVCVDTSASSSTSDRERIAEQWKERNETLLYEWLGTWKVSAECHALEYESYQKWQNFVALPSVLLPLIFSPLARFIPTSCTPEGIEMRSFILAGGFIACACVSALNAYCKWGVTAEQHLTSSKRYGDLVSDVEELLTKSRKDRSQAAVVLRTLKMKNDNLSQESPCLGRNHRKEVRVAGERAAVKRQMLIL